MGDLIASLKEFVWDIIGYLIPGFLFLLILNFILLPSISIENSFLVDWNLFNPVYIIIVLSYAVGFIIYSLTIFKVLLQDIFWKRLLKLKLFNPRPNWEKAIKCKISNNWEEEFKASSTFNAAKDFLASNGISNVSNMKVNEVRNILMSRNPEMDQKVYTFMFRSSVFDHIETILLLVSFLALIQFIISRFGFHFMKMEIQFVFIYIVFFLISGLLGNSKRVFFSISKRIPFSNLK